MKFGICTRYSRHEATFAAIRIGNWIQRNGHEVSMFTMTDRPPRIDPRWDRQMWKRETCDFTDWFNLEGIEAVFFTHVPHLPMIDWLRTCGCPIFVLGLWHEWEPSDRYLLAGVTTILMPHVAGYNWVRAWGLRNVLPLPWDTGEPVFSKPKNYEIIRPSVYLPLYDGNCNRMEVTALDIVERAMIRHPEARFTIAYSSSTITSPGHRRIRKLEKKYPQLTTMKGVPVPERPFMFQRHDLTLWPTEYESTCMVGLSSATMGTPVMTFRVPPVTECFNDQNAIYVSSQLTSNNVLGLPRAVPDYAMMDELLHQVLQDPGYLRSLQQQTTNGLMERRRQFNETMQQLMS